MTHSLAGMLLAEAVCVWRRETRQSVRGAAYLVSALANNLPDIDIVYTWITTPRPLGSLLHHRGHTHTLLVALPCAWLLGLAVWSWFSRRNAAASASERRLIQGLALVGPLLHLGMDFGNNYGIHPFWPLVSNWFYGDTIFIVEPLWWAIAIPIVASKLERRWLKVVLWVVLAATLLVCWFVPFVSTATRFTLLGVTAAATYVARTQSDRYRIYFAGIGCVSVALVFALCSVRAKAELRAATVAAFPALEVLDVATAPLPGNPTCWEGLLAGVQGDAYLVLRATVALGPGDPTRCAAGADVQPTAPVSLLGRANHGGVRWVSEYRAQLATLNQLFRDDCRFHALLKFARLPYVSASGTVAGDLRYDRKPELDFSDLELSASPPDHECPRFVPGWTMPRAELFRR